MGFFLIALTIGLSLVSKWLAPKPKRPKAQDLEGWFAEEGRPIPIIYGTQAISPNIVWGGDYKSQGDSAGAYYLGNLIGTLCLGEVDELIDIQFGGKSLALAPTTRDQSSSHTDTVLNVVLPYALTGNNGLTLEVHARQLYGGKNQEGGVEGQIRLYRGTLHQPVDPMTTRSVRDKETPVGWGRPGVCYMVLGVDAEDQTFYHGRSAQPKPIVVLLRRTPDALLNLGLNADYTNARIGFGANAAEMIYDQLTNPLTGQGILGASINQQKFCDFAAVCQREGRGLGLTVSDQDQSGDIIDEIKKHAECDIYEDPVTGLITISWARPDYDRDTIRTIDRSNAWDMEIETPHSGELANEVRLKYRRVYAGSVGLVEDDVIGPLFFQPRGLGDFYDRQIFPTNARNVTSMTCTVGSTVLTLNTDFVFDSVTGALTIYNNATTFPTLSNQLIKVTYTSNPSSMAFKEAVEPAYDLGDQQITGEVRSVTVDFPYLLDPINASAMAKRQLKALGMNLARVKWKMKRDGFDIYPLEPVNVTWADFPDIPSSAYPFDKAVRVNEVSYGTLENGTIEVTGIVDIWGDAVLANIPLDPGVIVQPGQAPAMAISCGLGGTDVRIAFTPSDATFTIQLWVADDAIGTNAVVVDEYAGTTLFYDTATTGKYYQARLVRDNWLAGPFTDWITCEPDGGTPTDPTCVEPGIVEDAPTLAADAATATLTLAITDPQNRVQSVEFSTQAGGEPATDFVTDTAPYSATVDLVPGTASTITYRVTYIPCAGGLTTVERTVTFTLPVAEPDPPAIQAVPVDVALLTGPWGALEPAASRVALSDAQLATRKFNFSAFVSGRLAVTVIETSVPAGTVLGLDYYDETTAAWVDTGMTVAVDSASVGTGQTLIAAGDPVLLPAAMRSDVRVRAMIAGGDTTGSLIFCDLAVQPLAQATDLPPDPLPDPPEEVPSACATTTDTFDGYTDTADLLATYADSAGYPTSPASYVTLDPTGGETGSPCVKVFVPDVTFGSAPYLARTVTGLTPGATAVVTCRGMCDFNPLTENSAGGLSVGFTGFAADEWQNSFPGIGVWRDFTISHAVSSGGEITIKWGFILSNGSTLDRNGYMDNLTLTVGGLAISLCGGAGGGSNTGGGETGTDPVPTPTPAGGTRPFGAFAIPTTGAGIWNATVKAPSTPANCVSLLTSADDNGITLLLSAAGTKSNWTNPDGTFNKSMYKAKLDALKADGASDAAITAKIASGVIFGFHIFDEPYAKNVYGGVQISAADVEWACAYTKSLWPGAPAICAMHVDSYPADIPSCDVYWSQYSLTRGDVTYQRDHQLALAAGYGKQLILGINVTHFTNPGSGAAITADQLRHYGGILASTSVAVAFFMWRYDAAWYNGTGIAAAVAYVQGIWESFD